MYFPLSMAQKAQHQRIHAGSSLVQTIQVIYTLDCAIKVTTANRITTIDMTIKDTITTIDMTIILIINMIITLITSNMTIIDTTTTAVYDWISSDYYSAFDSS